jgi:hypothetical protein
MKFNHLPALVGALCLPFVLQSAAKAASFSHTSNVIFRSSDCQFVGDLGFNCIGNGTSSITLGVPAPGSPFASKLSYTPTPGTAPGVAKRYAQNGVGFEPSDFFTLGHITFRNGTVFIESAIPRVSVTGEAEFTEIPEFGVPAFPQVIRKPIILTAEIFNTINQPDNAFISADIISLGATFGELCQRSGLFPVANCRVLNTYGKFLHVLEGEETTIELKGLFTTDGSGFPFTPPRGGARVAATPEDTDLFYVGLGDIIRGRGFATNSDGVVTASSIAELPVGTQFTKKTPEPAALAGLGAVLGLAAWSKRRTRSNLI